MSTRGKHNRRVLLVFASEIKDALDTLVKYRNACEIPDENPYLFANSCLG